MKIAILSPFYPYRGGIAQFNAHLYTELLKNNEVRAFNFTTLYPDFLFPGKTQYVTEEDAAEMVESEQTLSSINPISYIKTAKRINEYSPDVVIIPYWMSFMVPAFASVCILLKKNIKVVTLVHNAIPHEKRFIDKPFAKFFFNRCDAFIVMSEIVKKDLLSLKKNAITILQPHPIYDHYAEPIERNLACNKLGIKEDKKNMLFFGLIRDYKGLDLLIDAMGELDDNYQLIIAGESYGDFDKYRKQIDQSRLRENIIVFEEYIPDDMVSILFSAADVLVLPYRSATQSGVVALAYQMEVPMIATNVGALGSTVKESKTGIVTDSITKEGLTEAIKEYFSENSTIDSYKVNLKKEKTRLSWNNFIRSIESLFVKIL